MEWMRKVASVCMFMSILSIAGCFSSGSDSTETVSTPNVALTAVSSPESTTYVAGQPFTVTFTTEAESLDVEHVGVSFFLIERSQAALFEVEGADLTTYDLGGHYIARLTSGVREHTATLSVPNTTIPAGDYVITAYVDSTGVISNEVDISDNLSRSDDKQTYGSISIADGSYHDFVLDSVAIGDGFALFPSPGMVLTDNTGLPTGVRPDMVGYFYATKNSLTADSVDVGAVLTIGGVDYPAHLWHKVEQSYVDRMRVLFPPNEQSHYFPLDIAINGTLLKAIHDDFDPNASENTMRLTLTLYDTSGEIEATQLNNRVTIDVPYALFTDDQASTTAPILAGVTTLSNGCTVTEAGGGGYFTDCGSYVRLWSTYGWTLGDTSAVAIKPSLDMEFVAGSGYNGRVAADSTAAFDIYMFDDSASLIEGGVSAEATVDSGEFTYWAGLDVLGITVMDEGDTVAAFSSDWTVFEWADSVKLFDTTVMVTIVPITVEAGVEGSISSNPGLSYANMEFAVGGDILSASLMLYATAGVDILLASGGIGVDFLIVDELLTMTASMDLSQAVSNNQINFNAYAGNTLTAIEGSFYAWVQYYEACGLFCIKKVTSEYDIYSTDAVLDKSDVFVDETYTFSF